MNSRVSAAVVFLALTGTALTGIAVGAQQSSGSKAYKWVDDHGVTHYGDAIPPEYAKRGSSELNSQGVELRRFPAQLSPGDQAQAQATAEQAAKRRQHDQFLLTTYTSARDIEQLRDERLALLESQVMTARGYIDSIDARVLSLQARAKSFKPYSENANARRMPDSLAEELVRAASEGRSQRVILQAKQQEKTDLRARFQADIDRYQQLVSGQAAR